MYYITQLLKVLGGNSGLQGDMRLMEFGALVVILHNGIRCNENLDE